MDAKAITGLMDALGLDEEPMAMFFSDTEPAEGFSPKPQSLPTVDDEAQNRVDWQEINKNFSCVVGNIWLARRKKTTAYFSAERFGCLGGAFYLGFNKPQLSFIAAYVSTGIPGILDGESYVDSPKACAEFFAALDPPPAPKKFAVYKPISQLAPEEKPELISFFCRPEPLSGLHQLAFFLTNDPDVVASPFGAGCTNLVTWPLVYRAQGLTRVVLGGWDPSCRKFLKTDELTFTVTAEFFEQMLARWQESFLKAGAWKIMKKRIARSKKAWGEDA